jgi:hypothetical protein
MRRRLVNVVCSMPLAVCLLLCWVSVRGGLFGPGDGFARDAVRPDPLEHVHYGARTRSLGVELGLRRSVYTDVRNYNRHVVGNGIRSDWWGGSDLKLDFDADVHPRLERMGFGFGSRQDAGRVRAYAAWALRVPWWAIAATMLVPHAAVMARGFAAQRRINWRRRGRCAGCGYDLRSSTDRCPECGTPTNSSESGR